MLSGERYTKSYIIAEPEGMLFTRRWYITFEIPRLPLGPQPRFGDKAVKFQVVRPENGTAVLIRVS